MDSSKSSTRVGNSKQLSPSKHWCFTLNNYTEKDYNELLNDSSIEKLVIAKEVGESGTPHLQGHLYFYNKCRPKSHGFCEDRIHWEKPRNIEASIKYCMKTGDYVQRGFGQYVPKVKYVYELPTPYEWQKKVIELVKTKPDDRSIYWFWESVGCSGKTSLAKYIFTHSERVMILSGKANDMKHAIVKYREETGDFPRTILVNIPRSVDHISYTGLEEIKDMCFFCGKYETGMVVGDNPHLIVFANEEPAVEEMSLDRWNITKVKK